MEYLTAALNTRLYLIKRLSNHISKDRLRKIADSLYTSKIRYGVQLYGNVRTKEEDVEQKLLGSIQVAQNKLARFLNGNSLMDKIHTTQIYKELNLQSVNQINAQTKLLGVWKSLNSESHPTKWSRRNDSNKELRTRSADANQLNEAYGGKILTSTFVSDAAKIWNNAPESIKQCKSLYAVRKLIKNHTLTLPI